MCNGLNKYRTSKSTLPPGAICALCVSVLRGQQSFPAGEDPLGTRGTRENYSGYCVLVEVFPETAKGLWAGPSACAGMATESWGQAWEEGKLGMFLYSDVAQRLKVRLSTDLNAATGICTASSILRRCNHNAVHRWGSWCVRCLALCILQLFQLVKTKSLLVRQSLSLHVCPFYMWAQIHRNTLLWRIS